MSGRRARRHFHSALVGGGIAHQLVLLMLRIAIGRDVIEVAATHTHTERSLNVQPYTSLVTMKVECDVLSRTNAFSFHNTL